MNKEDTASMNTDEKQITLLYRESSFEDKKVLAMARDNNIPVLEVDIEKDHPTGTQLLEIADEMKLEISDLVRKEHPDFQEHYSADNLDSEDWIKIIRHNPKLLKTPIAMRGKNVMLIKTPTDILQINH